MVLSVGGHGHAPAWQPCVQWLSLGDQHRWDVVGFRAEAGHQTASIQETGELRVECKGFNAKNDYPRQTPCDPDFLRKIAKDTPADTLMAWFNGPVQQIFRRHRYFDKAGIFIADGSYIFVPDNENYEGSVKMLFDEHNHPVGKKQEKKMSAAQLKKCQWRRCYKMISLLHTNENGDFFLYAGMRIVPGNVHECPVLWEMVDEFVSVMGKGVIKDLILDRGFLDGEAIAKAKTKYGIDVTIGVKRNMNVFEDALGLVNFPEVQWESYTREHSEPPVPFTRHYTDAPRPEHIEKREAARQRKLDEQRAAGERPPVKEPEQIMMTRIKDLTTWSSCSVPLDLVVCRDSRDETLDEAWGILSTARDELQAAPAGKRYHLRIHIEERHRHLKCFWDLAEFTSPSFALVAPLRHPQRRHHAPAASSMGILEPPRSQISPPAARCPAAPSPVSESQFR